MNKEGHIRPYAAADVLRHLAPAEWARFGAEDIAYIRPILLNGTPAVAIHAADGTQIGAAPDTSLATAAILQHEMLPVLVH
ncbi:DUF1150 family protein [Roseomonas sp. KE0001]|uniref:DUF1150 family protein n=1 Tax=unclassified Roseomonas TaxID=2617492 RepID=UPI0018E05AAC|nr:hypothetical protein [Roseomonas sp. KE0001]MBI0432805.1 hypothetical protein [Roseomonas sp. KE0001]